MRVEDGGPAFPGPQTDTNPMGMSLRDYFAAAVMAGFAATVNDDRHNGMNPEEWAADAYTFADAMLAERAK